MILSWMAYAGVIAFVLALGAAALEPVVAAAGRPRRWIWTVALCATLLLAIGAPWAAAPSPRSAADSRITTPVRNLTPAPTHAADTGYEHRVRLALSRAADIASRFDGLARWIWPASTIAVLAAYGRARIGLARRRRQWRQGHVRGTPVFIAPADGPAVIGAVRPRIVVPEWALAMPDADVDLMIEHERQHLRARDALLMHAAGVSLLLMPWNPSVWWMHARLRLAVEVDCDARVLRRSHPSLAPSAIEISAYGRLLLAVASQRSRTRPLLAPSASHPSTLDRRIAAMCPTPRRFAAARLTTACGSALALVIAAALMPVPRLRAQAAASVIDRGQVTRIDVAEPRIARGATTVDAMSARNLNPRSAASATRTAVRQRQAARVRDPILVKKVDPIYTTEAMRIGIEGEVWLEGVVQTDGTLADVRVTRSLDQKFGLDAAAVESARRWTFQPALRNGQPVAFPVQLVLAFHLSKRHQQGDDEFTKGAYADSLPGILPPKPIHTADAKYSAEALRRKIAGVVTVEVVVAPDGTVARARVVQSLDTLYGLDDNALDAARQFTFEPGMLNGQPVPVIETISIVFRLH